MGGGRERGKMLHTTFRACCWSAHLSCFSGFLCFCFSSSIFGEVIWKMVRSSWGRGDGARCLGEVLVRI